MQYGPSMPDLMRVKATHDVQRRVVRNWMQRRWQLPTQDSHPFTESDACLSVQRRA